MDYADEILGGSLELLVDFRQQEDQTRRELAERAEHARGLADEARLALAELARPACAIVALRLAGRDVDWDGRSITKDREDTAWEVLSRIGVPKLRATAVAASITAHTQAPAPGAPGWVPPRDDEEDGSFELDPATIDGQIESFLAGVRAGQELKDEDGDGA